MDKVYKWVARFEEKPLPITVSNAKRQLQPTSFNKFLELTGYVPQCCSPKGERRLLLESLKINESIPVDNIKVDYGVIGRMQKDGFLFCIINKEKITRIK
jgi:hypothetical protein